MWEQLAGLATFILTFFVGQVRACIRTSRYLHAFAPPAISTHSHLPVSPACILTFFLGRARHSQAYAFWRKQLDLVRSLQGRIHDISFMASTFAARDADGNYT